MVQHFTFTVQPKHIPKNFPLDGLHICDITSEIEAYLLESEISNGFAVIQSLHSTLALVLNENESGLMTHDFPRLLRQIAPQYQYYRHDDFSKRTENLDPNGHERVNGYSHCRAIFLPSSLTLIVKDKKLVLGKWQRLLLCELDGHGRKDREITIMFQGE